MAKRGRRHNATGRSEGVHRHVRLHYYLLDSDAYTDMSLAGRACLVEFYKCYNGDNNGWFFISVRSMADRLNVSRNTAMRAINEVKAHGFVVVTGASSFSQKSRRATRYALTEHPVGAVPATKEFMRWKKPEIQKSVSDFGTDSLKI